MPSLSCEPALRDAIRELEEDRADVERLAAQKLQDAFSRIAGKSYSYEQVASDPSNAEVLAKLKRSLASDYSQMLDCRISALRKLCTPM